MNIVPLMLILLSLMLGFVYYIVELANIIDFYDYVEVQPLEVYAHLVPSTFENEAALCAAD